MVELESFVFSLSIALELIGAACVLICMATKNRKYAMNGEIGLIGCLCGLGSVTILGAMLRMPCGLVSGIAFVAMGLAILLLADRHVEENPFGATSSSR